MDAHSDIEVKPVVRLVNSIFRIILDNFERDDVISLLKTGLTANSPQEMTSYGTSVFRSMT